MVRTEAKHGEIRLGDLWCFGVCCDLARSVWVCHGKDSGLVGRDVMWWVPVRSDTAK